MWLTEAGSGFQVSIGHGFLLVECHQDDGLETAHDDLLGTFRESGFELAMSESMLPF